MKDNVSSVVFGITPDEKYVAAMYVDGELRVGDFDIQDLGTISEIITKRGKYCFSSSDGNRRVEQNRMFAILHFVRNELPVSVSEGKYTVSAGSMCSLMGIFADDIEVEFDIARDLCVEDILCCESTECCGFATEKTYITFSVLKYNLDLMEDEDFIQSMV